MNILCLVPASKFTKNVHRDVLYGCWCKGARIGGGTLPPLSLLSVATVLKIDGNEVRIKDMMEERLSLHDIKNEIAGYDLIIVLTSSMSFKEDGQILLALKQANRDIKTIVFGAHPTFMPEDCLEYDGVDICVRREPDFVIRDIVRSIKNGKSWHDVAGICFRNNGKALINEYYPWIDDIDNLPIPDRRLLPKNAIYKNPIVKYYPYTTSITSVGCPGRCTFCTVPSLYGLKFRAWSVNKVIDEIEMLISRGYREIYYRDETFTAFRERNRRICENIIRMNIKFSWICNARADTVNREDLSLMKRAGCRVIKVGVETGSQEILDRTKKMIDLGQIENMFRWMRELGIDSHAHLMFGMPGETKKTLKETQDFVTKIKPTTIDVGICTPYPGSAIFDELVKKYPHLKDWLKDMDLKNLHIMATYNELFTNVSKEDIEKSIRAIYRRFYLRPRYLMSWLNKVNTFGELKEKLKAGMSVIGFGFGRDV